MSRDDRHARKVEAHAHIDWKKKQRAYLKRQLSFQFVGGGGGKGTKQEGNKLLFSHNFQRW